MRLILVRHGETSCNVLDVWHGWDDCELTEIGLAQARAVAARLADEPIAAVYSSDSRRALQTARAIAGQHALEPVSHAGLRERNAGGFEGLTIHEIVSRFPTVWQDRDADLWGWSPPGGEPCRAVLDRGMTVVDYLQGRYPTETVVAVSHMSMVRALISRLGDIPLADTYSVPFPSTGVSIITIDGERSRLDMLNDASHTGAAPPDTRWL
ncbi:MAG TPA: histidine phosphatase family protein [Chloroflexota bacterium]